MLKKRLKYFSFNFLFSYLLIFLSSCLLASCVPKLAAPPLYRDRDLSLDEIITLSRGNIHSLKTVVDINVEKDNRHYSSAAASVLIKKPGLLQIRLYKFGMPVGNYLVRDKIMHVLSGRRNEKFREFGRELYYSVFWWEGLENAVLRRNASEYIIRTEDKEIHLDRATLLPERQEIVTERGTIHILYDEPRKKNVPSLQDGPEGDFWYQSVIKIEIGAFRFTVTVEKLYMNPLFKENDFKLPEEIVETKGS